MDQPLNESIERQARELARKITVAHDLDPEIQEELYGHIEDKLLAYKSGEERISDEDAFILVREHFGNVQAMRKLMQEVHMGSVQVDLTRKLLALVIATLGAYAALGAMDIVIREAALQIFSWNDGFDTPLVRLAVSHIGLPFALAGLWCLLYRWKAAMLSGVAPWFARWSISRLTVTLVFVGVVWAAVPLVVVLPKGLTVSSPYNLIAFTGLMLLPKLGLCALWIWWSGVAALQFRHWVAVCAAWAFSVGLIECSPAYLSLVLGASGPIADGSVWHLGNANLGRFFELGWRPLLFFWTQASGAVLLSVLAAGTCWLCYRYRGWSRPYGGADISGTGR